MGHDDSRVDLPRPLMHRNDLATGKQTVGVDLDQQRHRDRDDEADDAGQKAQEHHQGLHQPGQHSAADRLPDRGEAGLQRRDCMQVVIRRKGNGEQRERS